LLAIHTVALGATWFSWPIMQRLIEPATPHLLADIPLTKREMEVFYLLIQGKSNQGIGFKHTNYEDICLGDEGARPTMCDGYSAGKTYERSLEYDDRTGLNVIYP
jgi:hypothetical protein